MGIGNRLKVLRELGELKARTLDGLAGTTLGHAWLIESGRRPNIGADVASKYARALGASLDWLIEGTGAPPSKEDVLAAVSKARSRATRAKRRAA